MLYLVGLGLGDATDITVKGLAAVRGCSRVYLEAYTSILTVGKEALEEYYGMPLILADRDLVEQATTHSDLVLRAVHAGIPYKVIHNASIMNAVGCCGLQTVSLVFWTETWKPESFYDKICKNRKAGQHTLCLLDIKVKEQSIENMMRGKKIFEPPRFMTLVSCDLGEPLHSLVVTGHLHPLEVDMLRVNAEPDALKDLKSIDSSTFCS
ncbi:Diphthine methyl ester synthase [Dissostichus eleginoides]|uniref:Diphthine methyl ester synthase n=1 Tax=Dissostichus eleginoides TaxID=100907 RepID=A0AAD9C7Y8_DISEL|nr:Diphthine methyl ester synthase [Dissostichus eleginoides]